VDLGIVFSKEFLGYKGIFALLGNLCHVMTTSVVQVIEGLSEQLETALAFFGN